MIPLRNLHLLGNEFVGQFFDHSHWWLHLVLHAVVLVGPLALFLLLLFWAYRLLRRLHQGLQAINEDGSISARNSEGLPPSFFRYILRHTWRRQLWLLVGAFASLPVLYATLELPKVIVNKAIETGDFPVAFRGATLDQLEFLFVLCALFLLGVVVNGALKYVVNLHTGHLAETVLRRIRLAVYRIWRRRGLPGGPAQLIPVIAQEVEPIGGFSGEAFVLPALQGGTFLTIFVFMLMQDPILGIAAITLLPVQLLLIPYLQRRINRLARQRVREIRRLGDLIGAKGGSPGEPFDGILPITRSFRRLQSIRFELYRRKFAMKGVSNFISHLTPFFFYTIGGYLVIEGRLSFGALVAVLAAYKDFSSPLRELFRYYQTLEDVRIRYAEIRQFLLEPQANPIALHVENKNTTRSNLEVVSV